MDREIEVTNKTEKLMVIFLNTTPEGPHVIPGNMSRCCNLNHVSKIDFDGGSITQLDLDGLVDQESINAFNLQNQNLISIKLV